MLQEVSFDVNIGHCNIAEKGIFWQRLEKLDQEIAKKEQEACRSLSKLLYEEIWKLSLNNDLPLNWRATV